MEKEKSNKFGKAVAIVLGLVLAFLVGVLVEQQYKLTGKISTPEPVETVCPDTAIVVINPYQEKTIESVLDAHEMFIKHEVYKNTYLNLKKEVLFAIVSDIGLDVTMYEIIDAYLDNADKYEKLGKQVQVYKQLNLSKNDSITENASKHRDIVPENGKNPRPEEK